MISYFLGLMTGIISAGVVYVFWDRIYDAYTTLRNPLWRDPVFRSLSHKIKAAQKAHKPSKDLAAMRQARVHELLGKR